MRSFSLCILAAFGTLASAQAAHATPSATQAPSPALFDKELATEPREVRYVGYRDDAKRAQVFVTTTDKVIWHIDTGHAGLIVVTLDNTRIGAANNARALDTRFFNGPISWVEAQPIEGPSSSVRVAISSDHPELAVVRQHDTHLVIEVPRRSPTT